MSVLSLAFCTPLAPLVYRRATQVNTRRPRLPCATLSPPRPPAPPTEVSIAPSKPSQQRNSRTSRNGVRAPTAAPRLIADGDSVDTTWKHIAVITTHLGLSAALTMHTILATTFTPVSHGLAMLVAYIAADLFVGIYHHALDNYGSSETPYLGYQIGAFQGHHSFPWTITAREPANNLYRSASAAILPEVLLLLLCAPSFYRTFAAGLLFFAVLSQETHRQAHMTRPARWVRFLQKTGMIIGKSSHIGHHQSPHKDNYCILSGWWNDILDGTGFFRWLEGTVFCITGVPALAWQLEPKLKDEAMTKTPAWLRDRAALRREDFS